jgi:hypothetical protein
MVPDKVADNYEREPDFLIAGYPTKQKVSTLVHMDQVDGSVAFH